MTTDQICALSWGLALIAFLVWLAWYDRHLKKQETKERETRRFVQPLAGEYAPRYFAMSDCSLRLLGGMKPTIYFHCGACVGENSMKVPLFNIPCSGGLILHCQCCGKPNRIPIRRLF